MTLQLAGEKFGLLEIIARRDHIKGQKVFWSARCTCGKLTAVTTSNLRSGKIRSCGCLQRLRASEANRIPDSGLALLFRQYKHSAKKRGLSFTLSVVEFNALVQQSCHYCGDAPQREVKSTQGYDAVLVTGIDRKDNAIGYTAENCIPCCWGCNNLKSNTGYAAFLSKLQKIVSHRSLVTMRQAGDRAPYLASMLEHGKEP